MRTLRAAVACIFLFAPTTAGTLGGGRDVQRQRQGRPKALLRKGCDRAASGHPGRGEGTIEGPIGPGRCEPITGRPWVPIARLYSAPAQAGPPPEPARPPPGKRPPRRGARAALTRTIEGRYGVGPTGRVDRTPAGP